MARTGLFGGFYFDEEVFTDMMAEAEYWSNPILASGVIRNDQSIMDAIGAKGNVATMHEGFQGQGFHQGADGR